MSQLPLEILERGVAEVIDLAHLRQRLEDGKKLRVKLGIDPSSPQLHLGHAVPLRTLRRFQDAGHTAVLIIGDYTAQIGDPTDRGKARPRLTAKEVQANASDYLRQAGRIIDERKTEVRHQSEWYRSFGLSDVVDLLAKTTINHLLNHQTFAARLARHQPLHGHELLYPLLQGYDSVAVKADVELGGIDQKFNVLIARAVQKAFGQAEEDVVLFPYLPGTDGREKMAKSLGNTINLTDLPGEMFGKIMSLPDEVILTYFTLATPLPTEKITVLKDQLADRAVNPRDIKSQLAQTIVQEYYGRGAAQEAATSFDRQFRQKGLPPEMETLCLKPAAYDLDSLLSGRTTLVASRSEVRRLIVGGGIKKNGTTLRDPHVTVSPSDGQEVIIQIGARRALRLTWLSR